VSGDVKVAATSSEDGKQMSVQVSVPTMNVALPQKLKSGVQQLAEQDEIRVGTFRDEKTFVKLPLDKDDTELPPAEKPVGTVLDVNVVLGDITIVQGNQARIVLTGNPHIKITNTTSMTGQIEVKEGKVDVQGKQFVVERGTITFQPDDTSNPIIVATAEWTAEDGSKIYADFVGPVKTGKVNLRSDPPRPKNEILAIILFGTADGANAAPPPPGRAPTERRRPRRAWAVASLRRASPKRWTISRESRPRPASTPPARATPLPRSRSSSRDASRSRSSTFSGRRRSPSRTRTSPSSTGVSARTGRSRPRSATAARCRSTESGRSATERKRAPVCPDAPRRALRHRVVVAVPGVWAAG
jgi:hypothetical protein